MKQEDKDLLFKDLCGRLPYGVKCRTSRKNGIIRIKDCVLDCHWLTEAQNDFYKIKPYLFPLSSMSTSERNEIVDLLGCDFPWSISEDKLTWTVGGSVESELFELTIEQLERLMYIFNSRHYDYRGLIEKHLANDATGLGIYKQE